jgi:hypothetical protein
LIWAATRKKLGVFGRNSKISLEPFLKFVSMGRYCERRAFSGEKWLEMGVYRAERAF